MSMRFSRLLSKARLNRGIEQTSLPLLVLFLGISMRFLQLLSGTNYDFESYKITADSVLDGRPPWMSLRYNYGISWSLLLALFKLFSFDVDFVFRILIVIFLTLIDFLIARQLKSLFGLKVSIVFFLNPISIIVTGHYMQFDNVAILFGIYGIVAVKKYLSSGETVFFSRALFWFSLSLITKHNLVLFLPWLFFLNLSLIKKLKIIFLPMVVFVLHFTPFFIYSEASRESVLSSVFKYWSANNAPFWKFWFPNKEFAEGLGDFNSWHHGRLWMLLMVISVSLVGFYSRKQSLERRFAMFTIALITFSSAITSQFLVIAAIGSSVFFSLLFGLYLLSGGFFLLGDPAGYNLELIQEITSRRGWNAWNFAPSLLFVASLETLSRRPVHSFVRSLFQWGRKRFERSSGAAE